MMSGRLFHYRSPPCGGLFERSGWEERRWRGDLRIGVWRYVRRVGSLVRERWRGG